MACNTLPAFRRCFFVQGQAANSVLEETKGKGNIYNRSCRSIVEAVHRIVSSKRRFSKKKTLWQATEHARSRIDKSTKPTRPTYQPQCMRKQGPTASERQKRDMLTSCAPSTLDSTQAASTEYRRMLLFHDPGRKQPHEQRAHKQKGEKATNALSERIHTVNALRTYNTSNTPFLKHNLLQHNVDNRRQGSYPKPLQPGANKNRSSYLRRHACRPW